MVLDLDGSVGALPNEVRLILPEWQEAVRFGCSHARMGLFQQRLHKCMPAFQQHGTVFMGSGDFHHLSWPLVTRCVEGVGHTSRQPLRVVVLDNHPDNMRFPFGVHCGSWVRRVVMLPAVSHVHVIGITSGDISVRHAWENYLAPLKAGRLTYWSIGVDTRWSQWLGLGNCFRSFSDANALTAAVFRMLSAHRQRTYLSIDKDVFSPAVVRTNWDQGMLESHHAFAILEALRGQLVGSDVTGDVSEYRYQTAWKRWLSAGDGQDTSQVGAALPDWQAQQSAFNQVLLEQIALAS
ncbi:arginase family protein [Acidovorax sp. DW039]|nr:arginase family protein [Acidovorax sp. DW039]